MVGNLLRERSKGCFAQEVPDPFSDRPFLTLSRSRGDLPSQDYSSSAQKEERHEKRAPPGHRRDGRGGEGEFLDAKVARVRHVNDSICARPYSVRKVELTLAAAERAPLRQKGSGARELLHAMEVPVGDV